MPSRIEQAVYQLRAAYLAQVEGDYDSAAEYYRASLDLYPTAEAHTFLGWAHYAKGQIHQAIAECKRAIEVDPKFGNPYNDIGAYLIALERFDEAIPWLEHAITAKRYEPRHFLHVPYFNLGRVYLAKGYINRARELFQKSLEIEPGYTLARQELENIRRMIN